MQILTSMAIPVGLYVLGILSFTFPLVWLQKRKQKGKRSPLSGHLLRSPGTTLQRRIEALNLDIMTYVVVFPALPLLAYALYLPLMQTGKTSNLSDLIICICIFGVLLWVGIKVYRLMTEKTNCRLGLDAEMAVGQELNQLMADGYRVYHDFPAEDFNIDHILVGPTGVFAVETKGRTKADKRKGKVDAHASYDGKSLQFADWYETEPLLQTRRQADWLEKWLCSEMETPVSVRAVLALPGWYVVRKEIGSVMVISGREAPQLAKPSGSSLAGEMIQRIADQVEQRCRNVEPVAYPQEKKDS